MKIDFEENSDLASLFEGNLNPEKICAELELRTGIDIIYGKTLLFIDEIQICPRAIIALRYFYEKLPELHVIAAGSLIEFAFSEISFPVGRIQSLEVHPMNFSEFLLALAYNKAAEIDFLMQHEGAFVPVEVKDGPSGRLRSLHLYRNTYGSKLAVVFHAGITGKLKDENLIFLPLYFAGSFAQHGVKSSLG